MLNDELYVKFYDLYKLSTLAKYQNRHAFWEKIWPLPLKNVGQTFSTFSDCSNNTLDILKSNQTFRIFIDMHSKNVTQAFAVVHTHSFGAQEFCDKNFIRDADLTIAEYIYNFEFRFEIIFKL